MLKEFSQTQNQVQSTPTSSATLNSTPGGNSSVGSGSGSGSSLLDRRSKEKASLLTLQPPPSGKRSPGGSVFLAKLNISGIPSSSSSMTSDSPTAEPNMRQSTSQQRSSQLSWANNSTNRNSTGPFDVKEVQRRLKAEQDLEEDQRTKLIQFVNEKSKIDELRSEDMQFLEKLGSGNGGVVNKVEHTPSNTVMALKNIHLEIKACVRNQILRELQVLHECNSPYIVGFYGAFFNSNNISICMEYIDGGSLDLVLAKAGRFPEPIICKITWPVLQGLRYLHQTLRIMHRDVKPSNILVSMEGEVKLCDFGVSGKLIDSVAISFVGTRSYMAPERISGSEYNIRSDIWSLGLSLIELLTGRYPIPSGEPEQYCSSGAFLPSQLENMQQQNDAAIYGLKLTALGNSTNSVPVGIFDLLTDIIDSKPPQVPDFCFSDACVNFLHACLQKDPNDRFTLVQLLEHAFMKQCHHNSQLICTDEESTATSPISSKITHGLFQYSRDISMSNYLRKLLAAA